MMRTTFLLILCCMLFAHSAKNSAAANTDQSPLLNQKIKELQAANTAWKRNDAEFRKLRAENQSSATDIQEFAAFVAGLKRQVIEGCETVRQLGGDGNRHGVDCVKLSKEADGKQETPSEISERQASKEEQKNELEEELETLIAEFDELMLEQQNTLKEQQAARQTNGGDQGASEGIEAASSGATGEKTAAGDPGDGQMPPKAEPGSGPGFEKQADMPEFETADIADGSDDDVVARQLREAAEAETDPVLKAQLWEEYKKYKQSTR